MIGSFCWFTITRTVHHTESVRLSLRIFASFKTMTFIKTTDQILDDVISNHWNSLNKD